MGKHEAGNMAQWLRALCVLTEDSGSVPRTTSGASLYLHFQEIEHPCGPHRHLHIHGAHMHNQAHIHTQAVKINFKKG